MSESISLSAARRLACAASGLSGLVGPEGVATGQVAGAEGSLSMIAHLGGVQIDTISVVERAHHHILWSRVARYSPNHIARLEAEPRRIFEYWSHAAAWLSLAEYRFCLPRMERVRASGHDWMDADAKAVDFVRERIGAEGPLRVQDFEGVRGAKGWWDWKPAKIALEYLFHSGELLSVGREGFQKVYDLAERVLPADLDRRRPDEAEMAAWYLDAAERRLGIFAERELAYMRREMRGGLGAELARRVEEGSLVELAMEGEGESSYARPQTLELANPVASKARLCILSPFDPLIIDRRRLKRLFGVDFTIECYVPEAKRRFGYFALPLFFRNARGEVGYVGLLDAKAERKTKTLLLKRLSLERLSPKDNRSLVPALVAELGRYARFNGCERLELGRLDCEEKKIAARLRESLAAGVG